MARVARRDEAAFSILVERYGGRLLAVARRLLGSRADAEDAVQRALLQCYTAASSYQARWAVSTWLYRILTNVCVDELRRRAIRTAYGASIDVLDSARPREPRRTWICIARSRACRGRRAFSWRSDMRRGSPTASSRGSAASP